MFDILIAGGGPAGMTAALYGARGGYKTALIEAMIEGGQMATTFEVENYPGIEGAVSGSDLAMKFGRQAKSFGAEFFYENIKEINLGEEKSIVTAKNKYTAKTIIICTGASPRLLGAEGEKRLRGAGVSYCATCDGAFFRGKTTVVVGGGDTALEDAIFLSRLCEKVYLVHRRDTFRAVAALRRRVLQIENIVPVYNTVITEICGENKVESVKTKSASEEKFIKTDGVFIAVGNTPKNDLFARSGINLNNGGYIITDDKMRTNIDGVFAAGDIRDKSLRQIVTAAADGAMAAYSAAEFIENSVVKV